MNSSLRYYLVWSIGRVYRSFNIGEINPPNGVPPSGSLLHFKRFIVAIKKVKVSALLKA